MVKVHQVSKRRTFCLLVVIATLASCGPTSSHGSMRWQRSLGEHTSDKFERVSELAIGVDGSWIIAGLENGKILRWELNGRRQTTFSAGKIPVEAITLVPGYELLVAGYSWMDDIEESTLRVLELNGRSAPRDLTPKADLSAYWATVAGPAYPRAEWIASTRGSVVEIRSVPQWKVLHRLTHDGSVIGLTSPPDGRWLASRCFAGKRVFLWDPKTGKKLGMLHSPMQEVSCAAASPDGKMLIAGDMDGKMRLWNVESRALVRTWEGHSKGPVLGVAFHGSGKWVYSCGVDRALRVWSAAGALRDSMVLKRDPTCLAVQGDLLAIGFEGNTVGLVRDMDPR